MIRNGHWTANIDLFLIKSFNLWRLFGIWFKLTSRFDWPGWTRIQVALLKFGLGFDVLRVIVTVLISNHAVAPKVITLSWCQLVTCSTKPYREFNQTCQYHIFLYTFWPSHIKEILPHRASHYQDKRQVKRRLINFCRAPKLFFYSNFNN